MIELSDYTNEIVRLTREYAVELNYKERIIAGNDVAIANLKRLESELSVCQRSLSDRERIIVGNESTIVNLKQDNDNLKRDNENIKAELRRTITHCNELTQSHHTALQQKDAEIEQQKDGLQRTIAYCNELNEMNNSALKRKDAEIERLKAKLRTELNDIDSLKLVIDRRDMEIVSMRAKLRDATETNDELVREASFDRGEILRLQACLAEANKLNASNDVDALKQQIRDALKRTGVANVNNIEAFSVLPSTRVEAFLRKLGDIVGL